MRNGSAIFVESSEEEKKDRRLPMTVCGAEVSGVDFGEVCTGCRFVRLVRRCWTSRVGRGVAEPEVKMRLSMLREISSELNYMVEVSCTVFRNSVERFWKRVRDRES